MKRYFLIPFVVIAAVFAPFPVAHAQEVGHYQLFQGKYTQSDWDNGTSSEQNEIFLLDTATGDVQVYTAGITKGKRVKYWSPAVVDETKS